MNLHINISFFLTSVVCQCSGNVALMSISYQNFLKEILVSPRWMSGNGRNCPCSDYFNSADKNFNAHAQFGRTGVGLI